MTQLEYSLIFKVLGDETRVKILEMLSKEELCACKILDDFHITQPTLSYHMKKLCDVGLVTCRKDGKWNYYQINKCSLNDLNKYINGLNSSEDVINSCNEGDCR